MDTSYLVFQFIAAHPDGYRSSYWRFFRDRFHRCPIRFWHEFHRLVLEELVDWLVEIEFLPEAEAAEFLQLPPESRLTDAPSRRIK